MFYPMQIENKTMIILVMLHLKMEEVEEVVLKILIFHLTFLIFLKTFLVTLVGEEEEEVENQILEDQILGMIYQLPWKKLIVEKNRILNSLHLKNVTLAMAKVPNLDITLGLALCAVDTGK